MTFATGRLAFILAQRNQGGRGRLIGCLRRKDVIWQATSCGGRARKVLHLNDSVDYERVNEFLSAFAKVWDKETLFTTETAICEARVDFIVHYCEVDDPGAIETQANYGTYSVPGEGEGALEGYRKRVAANTVADYMEMFFGERDDFGDISGPDLHQVQFYDGYIYFGALQVDLPQGLALAESAVPLGEGLYRVSFDVYECGMARYNDLYQDCYSLAPEQLLEVLDEKVPASAGVAVVEVAMDGSLSLVSYDASVAQLLEKLEYNAWNSLVPAEEATRIEATYYTIDVPAELGNVTCEIDESFTNVYGGDGFGCLTTVHAGSGYFMVACITDGYSWQGDYEVRDLGEIPALPGYHLSIATPKVRNADPESFRLSFEDMIDELAAGVRLSEAAQVPATPAFRISTGDEACAYIIERLEATGGVVPPRVECTGEVEGGFRVRGYVEMKQGDYEYEVTQFWYDVGPDGSIYDTTFEREINPETMS